jgi:hypothetical protein
VKATTDPVTLDRWFRVAITHDLAGVRAAIIPDAATGSN